MTPAAPLARPFAQIAKAARCAQDPEWAKRAIENVERIVAEKQAAAKARKDAAKARAKATAERREKARAEKAKRKAPKKAGKRK